MFRRITRTRTLRCLRFDSCRLQGLPRGNPASVERYTRVHPDGPFEDVRLARDLLRLETRVGMRNLMSRSYGAMMLNTCRAHRKGKGIA